jgi:hypothetical protein
MQLGLFHGFKLFMCSRLIEEFFPLFSQSGAFIFGFLGKLFLTKGTLDFPYVQLQSSLEESVFTAVSENSLPPRHSNFVFRAVPETSLIYIRVVTLFNSFSNPNAKTQ